MFVRVLNTPFYTTEHWKALRELEALLQNKFSYCHKSQRNVIHTILTTQRCWDDLFNYCCVCFDNRDSRQAACNIQWLVNVCSQFSGKTNFSQDNEGTQHAIWVKWKRLILYVMLCVIWYQLCNLKNVKNTHEGELLLVKLQASACSKPAALLKACVTFQWTPGTKWLMFLMMQYLVNIFSLAIQNCTKLNE